MCPYVLLQAALCTLQPMHAKKVWCLVPLPAASGRRSWHDTYCALEQHLGPLWRLEKVFASRDRAGCCRCCVLAFRSAARKAGAPTHARGPCLAAGESGAAATSPVCSVREQLCFLRMGVQHCFGERAVFVCQSLYTATSQATLVGLHRADTRGCETAAQQPGLTIIHPCLVCHSTPTHAPGRQAMRCWLAGLEMCWLRTRCVGGMSGVAGTVWVEVELVIRLSCSSGTLWVPTEPAQCGSAAASLAVEQFESSPWPKPQATQLNHFKHTRHNSREASAAPLLSR
jgi:hypothetical protein